MKISLDGAKELKGALDSASDLSVVKRVVKVNTAELQRSIERMVPVQTGFLRRSFIMDIVDQGLTGKVSSNVIYGPHVEYGTFTQAAQPYMRPSLNHIAPIFKADIERELGG